MSLQSRGTGIPDYQNKIQTIQSGTVNILGGNINVTAGTVTVNTDRGFSAAIPMHGYNPDLDKGIPAQVSELGHLRTVNYGFKGSYIIPLGISSEGNLETLPKQKDSYLMGDEQTIISAPGTITLQTAQANGYYKIINDGTATVDLRVGGDAYTSVKLKSGETIEPPCYNQIFSNIRGNTSNNGTATLRIIYGRRAITYQIQGEQETEGTYSVSWS